jgi:transposase InsO family protein
MFSYEDRLRAVKLYLNLGKRVAATIRQLGYPTKNTLKGWHREFLQNQDLRVHKRLVPRYSNQQKQVAIEHYKDHGRCFSFTQKSLGYPCRETFGKWLDELCPEARISLVGRRKPMPRAEPIKRAAVIDFCLRKDNAQNIAQKLDVCRQTLYNWKDKLLVVRWLNSSRSTIAAMAVAGSEQRSIKKRLMKQEQLYAAAPKRRRYSSYLGEISPAPDNTINRNFHAPNPNEKWLTDITEFQIPAGKVYLSPMADCFDDMVVSWTIGTSPNGDLVNTMLDEAIQTVSDSEDKPIVHSDRGGHYRWPGWLNRMSDANLERSMSRKACSPDNAACEGFFGRLKTELFYARTWMDVTVEQFMQMVDSYIHWSNEKRIKISLGSCSPREYRVSLGLVT